MGLLFALRVAKQPIRKAEALSRESESMTNSPMISPFGNPGEPVAEVDPNDLRAFWQKIRELQAKYGTHVSLTSQSICDTIGKPGANANAIWFRSTMVSVLKQFAQERLADWIKDDGVSEAVFQTMATIPMEWIGRTEREGLPFDLEEFFRRLKEWDVRKS